MHVLYLIDSLIAGGAERSLASLVPEYLARGIEFDVAYLYERDNVWKAPILAAGADVVSLAGRGGPAGAIVRTRRLIRNRRPDLVHTTLFDADIVGRVATLGTRTTLVSSLVNAAYGPEHFANPSITAWRLRAARLLDRVTGKRVARFHAVSESVADAMVQRLAIPRDHVDVVPRGRDPHELGVRNPDRRAAARRSLGAGSADIVVLAVGRHEYQKGFDVLYQAFATVRADLPSARLFIAGRNGSETERLRALADGLGISDAVSELGFRMDVPELLCAADVFAAPSRWEGSPGGVLEAMALETPIIATDIDPIREVLGTEPAAVLVPPDDVEALARALREPLDDVETRARVAAGRARFLATYTIERVATEMLHFYERAANCTIETAP